MKPNSLFPLSLVVLLSGCVTPAPRRAEVTIPAPAATVRQSATAFLLSQDWRPVRSDDLVMVWHKDGTAHDRLLVDSSAKQEITLTLVSQPDSVRLLGFGARLYRTGSRTHQDISPGIQWHLDGIRATALGAPLPPPPVISYTNTPTATRGATR